MGSSLSNDSSADPSGAASIAIHGLVAAYLSNVPVYTDVYIHVYVSGCPIMLVPWVSPGSKTGYPHCNSANDCFCPGSEYDSRRYNAET